MQIKDTENYRKRKAYNIGTHMHGDLEKRKLKCGKNWGRERKVDGEELTEL